MRGKRFKKERAPEKWLKTIVAVSKSEFPRISHGSVGFRLSFRTTSESVARSGERKSACMSEIKRQTTRREGCRSRGVHSACSFAAAAAQICSTYHGRANGQKGNL